MYIKISACTISACDKSNEWQFAWWTSGWKGVPFCETGQWQWPFRGIRVGQASHPGPLGSMQLYRDEKELDEELTGTIAMATRVVDLSRLRKQGVRNLIMIWCDASWSPRWAFV